MAPALVPMDRPNRTFSQLYGDESKDPCKQNYQAIMNRFDANRDNALQGNVLYSQVVSVGGEVPQAYSCCGVTNNVPKIYCLHMPARFVAALDGMTTEWDDLSFAFLGDIVQGLVSIVQFPDDAFNSLAIPVKTVDCMLQHQDELANQHVFVLQDEDDSELIVTRSFMYLPAVYVPLMLNSRGYTEKQVWEILYPAIIQ
jgi:hypothetical protein